MIKTNQLLTGLAVLAIGVTGAFATGCGTAEDAVNDQVADIQKNVNETMNQQIDAAQAQAKQIQEETRAQIDEAMKEGQAPAGTQDSIDEINKQADAIQSKVNEQIEQANQQLQGAK